MCDNVNYLLKKLYIYTLKQFRFTNSEVIMAYDKEKMRADKTSAKFIMKLSNHYRMTDILWLDRA